MRSRVRVRVRVDQGPGRAASRRDRDGDGAGFVLFRSKRVPNDRNHSSDFSCEKTKQKPPPRSRQPHHTMADGGYVLPDKWSEDIVDEKGEKMSKR